MIRLFLKIAQWLDSRFPAKVIIRQHDYDMLKTNIEGVRMLAEDARHTVEEDHKVCTERFINAWTEIEKVKKDVLTLKDAAGKKDRPEAIKELNRARFIETGRLGA